jgi:hypothetical protein
VNAEESRELVFVRCGSGRSCNRHIATVHSVRNYHHCEVVLTPEGEQRRRTHLPNGLVVTTQWHHDRAPAAERRTPVDNEWPVVDGVQLFTWCPHHGAKTLDHGLVHRWAAEACEAKRLPLQRFVAWSRRAAL